MPNPITRSFWQWIEFRRARRTGQADGEADAKSGRVPWPTQQDAKGKDRLREDGKRKVQFNEYEMQVAHSFTTSVDRVAKPWEQGDQALLAKYRTASKQRNARQAEGKALQEQINPLKAQQGKLEARKAAFVPPVVEPKRWYWVVLVVFAIFEIPLNAIAFRPFREAELMNYALALLVGAVLVLLGHFAGGKLKEKRLGAAALMLALPLGTLCAIAYVRMGYLAKSEATMSSLGAFWVFWTLGAMVLAAAVVLAYTCEEGREEAQSVMRNLREVRNALVLPERRLKVSKAAFEACQEAVDDARTRRTALLRKDHREIRLYRDTAKALLSEYRQHYLRAYRPNAKQAIEGPTVYPPMGETGAALDEGDPDKLDWSVPEN
jgi:hypothetical protein